MDKNRKADFELRLGCILLKVAYNGREPTDVDNAPALHVNLNADDYDDDDYRQFVFEFQNILPNVKHLFTLVILRFQINF